MELQQNTLLKNRSFLLLPNKVRISLKDSEGERENYISYESLKGEVRISSRKNSKLFFSTLIMLGFAICILLQSLLTGQDIGLAVFPSFLALVAGFSYKVQQRTFVILETHDRQRIVLFRNKPNRKRVDSFLSQLWLYRKHYLREKYFYINYNHDINQQTERLRWLLEQRIITKTEFIFAQEDWIIDRSNQSQQYSQKIV